MMSQEWILRSLTLWTTSCRTSLSIIPVLLTLLDFSAALMSSRSSDSVKIVIHLASRKKHWFHTSLRLFSNRLDWPSVISPQCFTLLTVFTVIEQGCLINRLLVSYSVIFVTWSMPPDSDSVLRIKLSEKLTTESVVCEIGASFRLVCESKLDFAPCRRIRALSGRCFRLSLLQTLRLPY